MGFNLFVNDDISIGSFGGLGTSLYLLATDCGIIVGQ